LFLLTRVPIEMSSQNASSSKEISVVIPNYNHGRFLSQCLNSVINQTLPPIEILIGDGGSTDESLHVLDQFEKKYPKLVKVFKFDRLTVNPTIEFLMKTARGEYVAFLGADDYWDPRFLEELGENIGNSCVAYCDLYHVWPKKLTVWSVPDFDRRLLLKTNYISLNAAIIKKESLDEIRNLYGRILIDEAGIPSDWDLWIRLSNICSFTHVAKPLSYFRKHRQQNSSRIRLQWDIYQIYRKTNQVTVGYMLKMLVGGTLISFLQMYNLHPIADLLMTPINRNKIGQNVGQARQE
jgi:glycosyltransferase involved in cell wall biosynthesis